MKPIFDNLSHFAAPVPLPWFENEQRQPDRPFPAVQVLSATFDGARNHVVIQPLEYANPSAGFACGLLPVGQSFRMTERDYRARVLNALTYNFDPQTR